MTSFSESLAQYTKRLNKAFRGKSKLRTYNQDAMHAIEVIVGGFNYSKKRINLLSNELDLDIYGLPRVEEAVGKFLERENTELNILVEKTIALNHPILKLRERFGNKITIKRVPDDWQEKYSFNFMTMDDFGYRYEYDRGSLQALVSLREGEEMRSELESCFQILSDVSKKEIS